MSDRMHLLLPLLSSVLYVFGALWVRRAADLGAGVWRTTFVANVFSAVLFAPVALLGGPGQPLAMLWQPAVLAAVLVLGQTLGFLALSRGDVTVATPVLGAKSVMVAALTVGLLGLPVPARLWVAAGLSTGAIAVLSWSGWSGGRGGGRGVGFGLGAGLAAALAFALFDVLVQKWAPAWGAGRLLPLVMALAAAGSLGMIPLFREPLARIARPAWGPLAMGSVCIAVQGILLIGTVAVYGDATAVNVVYSARSLWTVLAVWAVGHWFRNSEQELGGRVLGRRLLGALLMTVAVVLATVGG